MAARWVLNLWCDSDESEQAAGGKLYVVGDIVE